MATSARSLSFSHLQADKTAQSITMPPGADSATTSADTSPPQSQPSTNGQTKPQKQPKAKPEKSPPTPRSSESSNAPNGEKKLSGAELKKQKAAEKAARRAEMIANKGMRDVSSAPAQQPAPAQTQQAPQLQRRPSTGRKSSDRVTPSPNHKRTGSTSGEQMPIRGSAPAATTLAPELEKKIKEENRVAMFSHLYSRERRTSIAGVGKEIHPAVLGLGLQLKDYVICGGNARCVALLLVWKKVCSPINEPPRLSQGWMLTFHQVIQAYATPPGVALSRHLTTHLSHQITHLSHCRPLSVSQGNSIRWLKRLISSLDPDLSDVSAKEFLCRSIDGFIREKVTLADELIAREASAKIVDGDVILTYAKSSVVEKTLLESHYAGKKFKVIVVDSRPLFEGKNLARSLANAGLQVQYCLLNGLASVVKQVTKCFLGASAMMGNGRLYSRVGTALVAMMAKEGSSIGGGLGLGVIGLGPGVNNACQRGGGVPVIVLCESIKFSSRVVLDSIVGNELGDLEALLEFAEPDTLTSAAVPAAPPGPAKGGKKSGKPDEAEGEDASRRKGLEGWRDQRNLHLLNLMYDATPAEYLDMIISELGNLPPSAVPIVNGVWGVEN